MLNTNTLYIIIFIYSGFEDCASVADSHDLQICSQHLSEKPLPATVEFIQLADIIMEEKNWNMPSNCEEALDLFMNLSNEIV